MHPTRTCRPRRSRSGRQKGTMQAPGGLRESVSSSALRARRVEGMEAGRRRTIPPLDESASPRDSPNTSNRRNSEFHSSSCPPTSSRRVVRASLAPSMSWRPFTPSLQDVVRNAGQTCHEAEDSQRTPGGSSPATVPPSPRCNGKISRDSCAPGGSSKATNFVLP